jgi:hypothetical protein
MPSKKKEIVVRQYSLFKNKMMKKIWNQLRLILDWAEIEPIRFSAIRNGFPGEYRREWKESGKLFRERIIVKYECNITDAYSVGVTLIEISGETLNVETTLKAETYIGALEKQSKQIRLATSGNRIPIALEQSILFYRDNRYQKTIKAVLPSGDAALKRINNSCGVIDN